MALLYDKRVLELYFIRSGNKFPNLKIHDRHSRRRDSPDAGDQETEGQPYAGSSAKLPPACLGKTHGTGNAPCRKNLRPHISAVQTVLKQV
jgi:hypothetical protein